MARFRVHAPETTGTLKLNPLTATVRDSPAASEAVPVIVGLGSLVRSGFTAGAVGAIVSITMLRAPAILFVPVGTVVFVSWLPNVSVTNASEMAATVRSEEFSPGATTYVPVRDVPCVLAISTTTAPVSSTMPIDDPAVTVFDAVAVIWINWPAR